MGVDAVTSLVERSEPSIIQSKFGRSDLCRPLDPTKDRPGHLSFSQVRPGAPNRNEPADGGGKGSHSGTRAARGPGCVEMLPYKSKTLHIVTLCSTSPPSPVVSELSTFRVFSLAPSLLTITISLSPLLSYMCHTHTHSDTRRPEREISRASVPGAKQGTEFVNKAARHWEKALGNFAEAGSLWVPVLTSVLSHLARMALGIVKAPLALCTTVLLGQNKKTQCVHQERETHGYLCAQVDFETAPRRGNIQSSCVNRKEIKLSAKLLFFGGTNTHAVLYVNKSLFENFYQELLRGPGPDKSSEMAEKGEREAGWAEGSVLHPSQFGTVRQFRPGSCRPCQEAGSSTKEECN
ncbi:hypothetical protein RRG08_027756 [Elysia crispata]|uniref:Uncharacterized protein n=1 Tax=Elysia crispata TaxID=231223 RepID=A0AAE0Z9G9_9GAST|nr:hypothetical protein RRG08_027756 [Elysia crispata]